MEQNSKEWLAWRHAGIGASDANVIMGVSKYKKRSELLLEKRTPFSKLKDHDSGPVAELGHIAEALERPRFEMLNDIKISPELLESKENPFIRASYDGFSEDQTMAWEHKLVGKDLFEEIKSGECPAQYYPQIQQQFYVTPSIKEIHLCAVLYKKEMLKQKLDPSSFERASVVLKRDENYINEMLLPELLKFWGEVSNAPMDFSSLDNLARKRELIKLEIKKLDERLKDIEKQLIDGIDGLGGEASSHSFSYSYKEQKRTSYDTKKMIADGFDIEPYKKESSFSVLRVNKKSEG